MVLFPRNGTQQCPVHLMSGCQQLALHTPHSVLLSRHRGPSLSVGDTFQDPRGYLKPQVALSPAHTSSYASMSTISFKQLLLFGAIMK